MYIAELRGKAIPAMVGSEDILTSNVFSFFKYVRRDIFLKRFLQTLDIIASDQELEDAEFRFWPRFEDNTEPDLVLIVGKYYLLIEAKYRSDFAKQTDKIEAQLIRESVMGMKEANDLGMEFILLGLTADYYYPAAKFAEIPAQHRGYVRWTNWQRICSLLFEILEEGPLMTHVEHLFAGDFYQLLVAKRLRPYQGTMPFLQLDPLEQLEGDLFFPVKARHYSGVFNGFEKALSAHSGPEVSFGPIFLKEKLFWQSLSNVLLESEPDNRIFYEGVNV